MQDYRNLEIWQRSMEYVVEVYRLSSTFPADERYNLVAQLRRASTSIPLNISEGAGCDSDREFAKYLVYAYRSSNEVMTCLELARRLDLCHDDSALRDLTEEATRLCRMIYSLIKRLKAAKQPLATNQQPSTMNHKPLNNNQQPCQLL